MMTLTSPAFVNGGEIPTKYGCRGEDLSIPLAFRNVPQGTKSLALIMEDPDAPGGLFVHWVIYDMPADLGGLPEGVPPVPELDLGIRQGVNDFGKIGYGGPCPPDRPHRYFLRLFALDIGQPAGEAGLSRAQLLRRMEGHVLAEADLMGIYAR
ncbi:YbhB/YbcL family Raf kinase inhibitor-like protein [Nitratifractor sp.]